MIGEPGTATPQLAVLVIDDEDYVADMIAAVLRIEGFVTTVAYNGREGLQRALDFRGDLIIVDIMMPFLSGIELVEHIRQYPATQHTPIVLISAGARPPAGMRHVMFLAKPFDIEQLLEIVHGLIQENEPGQV